jgi:hypothetical protein
MPTRKILSFSNLGTYFDIGNMEANKVNPLLPTINPIQLTTTPLVTGNTTNLNEFVIDVNGFKWFIDYSGDALQLSNTKFIRLATNQTSTSTTRVNTPGFTFNVVAGKSYKFEYNGLFQTAATTTGASVGVVLASGAGTITGYMEIDISQATVATGLRTPIRAISTINTLVGSFIIGTSVSVANSPHNVFGNMVFTCTTSGVINFQFGSEVNLSTATLLAGTSLIVTQLN